MKLHKAIDLYLSRVTEFSYLGTRASKVALSEGRIQCMLLDSFAKSQTSSLMLSYKKWKKLEVRPSGPGALPYLS